jgi:hypothetical protein
MCWVEMHSLAWQHCGALAASNKPMTAAVATPCWQRRKKISFLHYPRCTISVGDDCDFKHCAFSKHSANWDLHYLNELVSLESALENTHVHLG